MLVIVSTSLTHSPIVVPLIRHTCNISARSELFLYKILCVTLRYSSNTFTTHMSVFGSAISVDVDPIHHIGCRRSDG